MKFCIGPLKDLLKKYSISLLLLVAYEKNLLNHEGWTESKWFHSYRLCSHWHLNIFIFLHTYSILHSPCLCVQHWKWCWLFCICIFRVTLFEFAGSGSGDSEYKSRSGFISRSGSKCQKCTTILNGQLKYLKNGSFYILWIFTHGKTLTFLLSSNYTHVKEDFKYFSTVWHSGRYIK